MTATPLPTVPELAVRTHCPYCAFQCGVLMGEDLGGDLPRVSGDPHFPVNNGQLCIKGWTSGALLGHPRRVTAPQLRDARGQWRPADWDEALDFVAAKLAAVRGAHGADANGVFGSGALTNEKAYLLGKFARIALGTANIDYNGRFCMSSAAGAQNRALGIDRGLPFPVADIEHAEVVMLVGANPADTLPPMMQWFDRQRVNGGRLVVADPRRTATAHRANLFLQLTPGTDLALANGLLYLALEEHRTDARYIAERTTGFEAARAVALQYHPARVERLTGIGEAHLRQAVRWLATARSAMVLTGRGTEQHSKGVDSVHAWINLMLALGKVGEPHSGFGTLTGQGNGQGGREHGQKADQL
ncbi:MAG TPA: molybdopterin-dependent oxidoreductase, partial [Gemmata sp.]